MTFLLSLPLRAARPPWLWTIEERIQVRTDATLARQRVAEAEAKHSLPSVSSRANRDAIDGSVHPELFLPTEVFESLVRGGYVGETWRDVDAPAIAAVGLPADFWDQLERVARPYIADLTEMNALVVAARDKKVSRAEAEQKSAALSSTLCADRADALTAARKLFGPALDELMYRYIAPRMAVGTDTPPTADALRSRERGCR